MTIGAGQLLGNYRLIHLLGRGGFADVYLAEHIYLGTHVAIKVLSMRLTSDNVELFIKEARTAANLVHPHILRVLDFGIEQSIPYLVMDYARNGTLRQRHPKGSILPLETIVSYTKQIAPALQYIHERKLIHRDIKPENLLIGRGGAILISDFGIATVAHSTRSLRTEGAAGTIYYMAPEQIQGHPRPASDQYALGVLVYEWLCGTPPFTGTAMEIGMQHLLTSPPPLNEKSPAISHNVEQVILTALAKDPHQRFEDVQAFADALAQAYKVPIGTPIYLYTGHSSEGAISDYFRIGGVRSVLWSPDSTYVASSGWKDGVGAVHIWNATDGVQTQTLRYDLQTIGAMIWRGNILYVATLEQQPELLKPITRIINTQTRDKVVIEHDCFSFWAEINRASLSPDGEFIAILFGHTIYEQWGDEISLEGYSYDNVEIRATSSGEKVGEYLFDNLEGGEIPPVTWSPDSRRIAFGLEDEVIIWEANAQKVTLSFPISTSSEIVWSPDGQYLAVGSIGEVKVFNALAGDEVLRSINLSRTTGEYAWVSAVAWSPDSKHIISAFYHESSHSTIDIWDTTTGENTVIRHTQFGKVVSMDWSPDGKRIAVAFEKGYVEVWRAP